MTSTIPTPILDRWLKNIRASAKETRSDDPNYYISNPETLITTSEPSTFSLGTGAQILSNIFRSCLSTNQELIIITCFWAKSQSQEDISTLLLELSSKAMAEGRKIEVRLCFSSRSITQKLFQTCSLNGKIYPSSSWVEMGLPAPEKIEGLDLVVKSVFVRPFSVMHPKFILVDRKLAFMPSCNVSWEEWFEGCIEMRGEVCQKLFDFWVTFWSRGGSELPIIFPQHDVSGSIHTGTPNLGSVSIKQSSFSTLEPTPTILLPSPHHINPKFNFSKSPPPPTPLNAFLLDILASAQHKIFIQTPNLTSHPVISAILSALKRGIEVHIITSSRLMILEQLVTAGTITEFEVWKLRWKHKSLLKSHAKNVSISGLDLDAQLQRPGVLRIGYYHPRRYSKKRKRACNEPVKSHLKLTIVDEKIVVLGSGNMDRASWYTSQELGVAFFSKEMAGNIKESVEEGLEGRVRYVC